MTSPSFSPVPGEYRFTSGSWDKIARIWSLNGELITCQGYSSLVVSLCFSPDGKHIASGSDVGKLPYEILGVDHWLFSYLKDTHLRSTQSVILPMKLWLSLDQLIEWSVFGILPIATYFLRWKVIRSLSTPSLALILNPLLSLETTREQSESGMQKSNSSPWTYRHNQVGEVIMFLLWWYIDCLQRGWRIYFCVRHIDWQFFF